MKPPQPAVSSPQPAFVRFVDVSTPGADTLAGLVGYGIYKRAKREWVIQQSHRLKRELTPDEVDSYLGYLTPSLEHSFKQDADDILKVYAAAVIKRETPNIIAAHLGRGTFKKDVAAGVLAALIWTVILTVAGLIVSLTDPDVFAFIEAVHKVVHGH